MRRAAALLLALPVLALAGCGDDGGSGASGPLDEALGYLPEDAPLVITIDTDVDGAQFKALESIADRFPFGDSLRDDLLEDLELGGGDFEEDIKPILGNAFVVGGTDVGSIVDSREDDDFVAAIEAKDKGALEDAVKKEGAKEQGEQNGATVYEDNDGDSFAIKDDVLVVAGSRRLLDQALQQRDADDRLTEETFEKGLEGLPKDALVKVYGDIGALVENDPDTEDARKVKWVAALDKLGLTAAVQEDEIAIDFNLTTDGDLSDEDLPLAAGGESPGVVQRGGEVGVGLRDLDHIYQFALSAAQAVNPSGFGEFQVAKKQIAERYDVSIDDDVFGQLQGDVSVSLAVDGGYAARAELKDPDAFRETLKNAEPVMPSLLGGALGSVEPPTLTKPKGGDGLYELSQEGGERLVFGVMGDVLVVSDSAAGAARIAAAEPEQVEGAKGSFALKANAESLADAFFSQQGGLEGLGGQLFTGPLGDLTGSVESSTDGLSGNFTLGID